MPSSYKPLRQTFSLQELSPQGWYLRQLRIQADGLSGHLDEFWPDIMDSRWIGGNREGWERMPYWLDGVIPLSVLLHDEALFSRARRYIDAILAQQQPDGWICPVSEEDRIHYDIWAAFLIGKVLVVWHDATGDARIQPAVAGLLRSIDLHIDRCTLFNWGQARWFECLIPLLWLYERQPEEWLVDLAKKLQCQGFDWIAFFRQWPMAKPHPQGRWSQMNHVVNQAMMLKMPALLTRLFPQESSMADATMMLSQLDQWHGNAAGMFNGDECLAGTSPAAGTELCAVAETMYSLQWLQTQSDDAHWGDRLEEIAFNAWPATFDPSMWAHQYVQQVNQVQAVPVEDNIYHTNGPDANTFGLEPEFGCCTANLSQGWPKLIQSAYYRCEDGIDIALWLPSRLDTHLNGAPVSLCVDTGYPFRENISLKVENTQRARFILRLRIPAWAEGTTLEHDGCALPCMPGHYAKIIIDSAQTDILLRLPQKARFESRPSGLTCLKSGPLLYALAIEERWTQVNQRKLHREYPHCDYWVTPESRWNYGVLCGQQVTFHQHTMDGIVFSPQEAPVDALLDCRPVDWPLEHGVASASPGTIPLGEVEKVRFIPYGCTCLRIGEFPLIEECAEPPEASTLIDQRQ